MPPQSVEFFDQTAQATQGSRTPKETAMSNVQSKLGEVCLRAHVKAGDTKANSFAFALRQDSWKKSYLTVEELEWLADNSDLIREVIAENFSVIRSASERKTERDAQKQYAKGKKQESAQVSQLAAQANMGAMFQAFMAQMVASQKQA
jgi:hypothetical protein